MGLVQIYLVLHSYSSTAGGEEIISIRSTTYWENLNSEAIHLPRADKTNQVKAAKPPEPKKRDTPQGVSLFANPAVLRYHLIFKRGFELY